jgi:hypothetical protein
VRNKIFLAIFAFFILLIGGLIYLCFRQPTILLFRWLDYFGFNYSVFQNINIKLPLFIINHLPNAVFIIFACIFIYIIWGIDKFHYFLYTSIIIVLNIIYEIIVNYDIGDIMIIIFTFIICSILYIKTNRNKI